MTVRYEVDGAVATVSIDRPRVRNAVDVQTAAALVECFSRFDADPQLSVAVLTGSGGNFCAGFDLKALAAGSGNHLNETGSGPMGPTRMLLSKPVIAAVEGYAVAGGLELALWCDLRVAASNATFGVFNRRFGVPLIDMGTIRLPRMIGQGRALDLILTGRPVVADEALRIGLVERLVEPGQALAEAQQVAHEIAAFPPGALRTDRLSVHKQWSLTLDEAAMAEFQGGADVMASGEPHEGARRFAEGSGRHGS
ncbi:MAG TPA: crotonase/enoyl-CoA hydratase family protein [Candidatus Dormibacteraeota bacterium]|nr:crotonase/enoyl-CoA hydratase family protein [Candidatus Dormibacteraeota bacterium]